MPMRKFISVFGFDAILLIKCALFVIQRAKHVFNKMYKVLEFNVKINISVNSVTNDSSEWILANVVPGGGDGGDGCR